MYFWYFDVKNNITHIELYQDILCPTGKENLFPKYFAKHVHFSLKEKREPIASYT